MGAPLVCISSVCLCSKYLTHLMLMYVMGICTMKIRVRLLTAV